MARVKFRYQIPSDAIYRVGPIVGTQPQARYSTIQSAIAAALADGHTNNDNPALIEVYPGTYTGDVNLLPGIHIRGMITPNSGLKLVKLNGRLIYDLISGGTLDQNQVTVENLTVTSPDDQRPCIMTGTSPGLLNLVSCALESSSGGAGCFGVLRINNSGGSTIRCSNTSVNANNALDNEVVRCTAGTIEMFGGRFGITTATGITVNSGVRIEASGVFTMRMQQGINGSFDRVVRCQSTSGQAGTFERCTIVNSLVGGVLANFQASGSIRFRQCSLFLADSTSKLASGGTGSIQLVANIYGGAITAPITAIDSGTNVFQSGYANGPKDTVYREYLVGRGSGYPTIQAALDAADNDGPSALRRIVRVPPGNYTEDLTLYPDVDLVADTQGITSNFDSTVRINGNHQANFTGVGGAIQFKNINFNSTTNNLPIFTFLGDQGRVVRFKDCFFYKSFADAVAIFDVGLSTNFTLMLEDCLGNLESDGGVIFNLSNQTGFVNLVVTGSKMNYSNVDWNLSQVTAGPALQNRFVSCPDVAAGSSVDVKGCTIGGLSSRLIDIKNTSDNVSLEHCSINAAFASGEIVKFTGAGSFRFSQARVGINGDGVETGIPVIARDGGTQASGTFTFNANPAPGDTVEVDGTTITFNTDVTIGATKEDTALNLANFINGLGSVVEAVNLIAGSAIVTVKALNTGVAGNAITFLSSTAAVTASGAGTLAGGVNGSGGNFFYGSSNFNSTFIQGTLSVTLEAETLTSI